MAHYRGKGQGRDERSLIWIPDRQEGGGRQTAALFFARAAPATAFGHLGPFGRNPDSVSGQRIWMWQSLTNVKSAIQTADCETDSPPILATSTWPEAISVDLHALAPKAGSSIPFRSQRLISSIAGSQRCTVARRQRADLGLCYVGGKDGGANAGQGHFRRDQGSSAPQAEA